ncbi:hypothetical protein FH609_018735 [Streptomyces sp. 3MP-14]|uniref:Uncharacterized protein n=2 Tax=Streptomyces TaxID=1883 RepID=A0A5N6A829_9ACTN|nr:hypothetical protein FH607_017275 [Streptomyces mimosae]KAB8175333.1 hypothetical protein FH609_018735 [Streptomyces sp. 3MP-14]
MLARASTLARQGRGRGLAEHWQALKYCQALAGDGLDGRLVLTEEGQSPERWYRSMQARELGRALGLAVAERAVRDNYPEHLLSTVDAEVVLLAGFARSGQRPTLGMRPRPDFLIEAWRPGEPSIVFVVTVNGNHQVVAKERMNRSDRTTLQQLARGSERAEHFHLGKWNNTPCLLVSTELLARRGITAHALMAPGAGRLPVRPPEGRGSADVDPDRTGLLPDRNLPFANAVPLPSKEGSGARSHDGFFVPEADLAWFGRVLARSGAASQLAFAGAGVEIAPYLTEKQGFKHYRERTFAGASSVRDAEHQLGQHRYVGTDQVFRLGGRRVEAFSGMAKELYAPLARGEVEEYRRRAYELRDSWPRTTTVEGWGPASFGTDGTVMALRLLPGAAERPSSR